MSTDLGGRIPGRMSGPGAVDGPARGGPGPLSAPNAQATPGYPTETSVRLPEPLRWLLEDVVGQRWPLAIEDDLHAAADVWRHLGGQIAGAHRATEPAAGAVVAYNSGPAVDAFAQFWRRFSTQPIPRALAVCTELEQMLRQFAQDTAAIKTYILGRLDRLADEVDLRVTNSGITLGVSDTTAATAAAVTRAAIREALGELAARTAATAARMAARSTATELLNDPTLRTLQQLDDGHRLEPQRRSHPSTLGAGEDPVGIRPTAIGRTSLIHTAADSLAVAAAEASSRAPAETETSGPSLSPGETGSVLPGGGPVGGPVATSPVPESSVMPTDAAALATSHQISQESLIARVMAGGK